MESSASTGPAATGSYAEEPQLGGQQEVSDRQPRRALIVEDDAEVRKSLEQLFTTFLPGIVIQTAENGAAALDQINQRRPDVVVTDYRMPEMDGLEMLRRLGDAREGLPVIMLTAFADPRLRSQAQRLGVKLFMAKPFEIENLIAGVQGILGDT